MPVLRCSCVNLDFSLINMQDLLSFKRNSSKSNNSFLSGYFPSIEVSTVLSPLFLEGLLRSALIKDMLDVDVTLTSVLDECPNTCYHANITRTRCYGLL